MWRSVFVKTGTARNYVNCVYSNINTCCEVMIFSENSKVQTLGDWFFVTLRNKYLMLINILCKNDFRGTVQWETLQTNRLMKWTQRNWAQGLFPYKWKFELTWIAYVTVRYLLETFIFIFNQDCPCFNIFLNLWK